MLAGQVYDPNDEELVSEQFEYLNAMKAYNALPYGDKREEEYLRKCFGAIGKQPVVTQPFFANWGGKHVFIGDYFYSNFNLTLVDDGKIEIGDNVMIGPNVSIITAGHPVSPKCRLKGLQYNADVKIGNNVWIGAGVNVLPGVTIGDNCVIGAGSVVTRDIPAGSLAAGVPCKVIRPITEADSMVHKPEILADNHVIGKEEVLKQNRRRTMLQRLFFIFSYD